MLNHPVLILNQSYEPLNVCRVRRAVVLVLSGKAEVLEQNSNVVRSPTFSIVSPSVIRLNYMVKRSRLRVKLTRQRIFIRDRYTCQYCGKKTRDLTLDHVIPRYQDGKHSWDNMVGACSACNQRKAGRTPVQAGMKLLRKPFQPSMISHCVIYPFEVPPEWQKYAPADWMN